MRCPLCHSTMTPQDFGEVEVDFCEEGCGGIWFDWAELRRVDEPEEGFGSALDAALTRSPAPRRSGPLTCTRCSIQMREHRYKRIQGVMLDECYECRGFFLDPGELQVIRDELGARIKSESAVRQALERKPCLPAPQT